MLDAGHGGRDPGAVYNGRQEKIDTLSLTLAIGQILQERGIDVLYTRTTDIYESPYQKAMEANEAGVDFFISIHRNSFPQDNAVSGVESLVYEKPAPGSLSSDAQKCLRFLSKSDLSILTRTTCSLTITSAISPLP